MKDTTTRVRVYIDRVVLEPAQDDQAQAGAHLISMITGDSESRSGSRSEQRSGDRTIGFLAAHALRLIDIFKARPTDL